MSRPHGSLSAVIAAVWPRRDIGDLVTAVLAANALATVLALLLASIVSAGGDPGAFAEGPYCSISR